MSDEHVFDLLPCYALGILDDTEQMMVSRHLSGCEICRKELISYNEAHPRMGFAVPRLDPDAVLKARVLDRVNSAARQNTSSPENPPGLTPESSP